MERYEPQRIEKKWQAVWEAEKAFYAQSPQPGKLSDEAPKSYVLEMLPYPSGTLHMGHVLVYTLGDILAHFRRRNGMNVLRPMGFDSFGLPSENAAIREGGHPREITERNIEAIRASMKRIGWAIDWDREISTHLPEYYKWTQWVFLRFFEQGHVYRANAPVKWCPKDQTVLANEQVKDGRCERCGSEVVSKNLEQWFFRITPYADQLLDDMDGLDWPERILAMQRHWIGRSEGAEVLFRIDELDVDVPVFTTRPDTLFGATFFVLAPEHELVERLDSDEMREYVRRGVAKKGEERAAAEQKTGVFTGWHATNPVNGERIPIWVADYVLPDYGTGAIMAVPANDERDRQFAETFDLPIREVIDEDGALVNSGEFDRLPAEEGKQRIIGSLADQGRGRAAVNFRLRDWLLSRQRYWGCPIPIVHCDECGPVAVPDDQLPVVLPEIEDYMPKGVSPLATAEEWVNVDCPRCGRPSRREVDTMDTFVDSSWYFIRYCDPDNTEAPWDRELADFWGPVDQYTGGVDHATMHMIYARYFCKALTDMGLLGYREPFLKFFGNGWVQMGQVKMSKRAGNIVGPEQLVEEFGADPVRLYILFIGPADEDMEWTEGGLEGMRKFVRRLWRVVHEVVERAPEGEPGDGPLARKTHETIARVTDDLGRRYSFNTAISAVMELVNELSPRPGDPAARFAAESAVSLIQPYAPHVAEELWERLGNERLWAAPWPVVVPEMLERDTFQLVVQVNGKVRDRVEVPSELSEDELIEKAKAAPRVRAMLDGQEIGQTIVVPRKLVNIVLAKENSP